MTRFIHDQFAKQYLTEIFTPYGKVEVSQDIISEKRQIKDIDQDDQELIMKLSEMYQELLEQIKEEVRQKERIETEKRERRAMAEKYFTGTFW
jgi:hypothetical protein